MDHISRMSLPKIVGFAKSIIFLRQMYEYPLNQEFGGRLQRWWQFVGMDEPHHTQICPLDLHCIEITWIN